MNFNIFKKSNNDEEKSKRRTFLILELKEGKSIYLSPNNYDFIAEKINKQVEHIYIEKGYIESWWTNVVRLLSTTKLTITVSEIQFIHVQKIEYVLE